MKIKIVNSDIPLVKESAYFFRSVVFGTIGIKMSKRTFLDFWAKVFGYSDFGELQASSKNYPKYEVSSVFESLWDYPDVFNPAFDVGEELKGFGSYYDKVCKNYINPIEDNFNIACEAHNLFKDICLGGFSSYYAILMFFGENEIDRTKYYKILIDNDNKNAVVISSFLSEFVSWTMLGLREVIHINDAKIDYEHADFFRIWNGNRDNYLNFILFAMEAGLDKDDDEESLNYDDYIGMLNDYKDIVEETFFMELENEGIDHEVVNIKTFLLQFDDKRIDMVKSEIEKYLSER